MSGGVLSGMVLKLCSWVPVDGRSSDGYHLLLPKGDDTNVGA